MAKHRGRFRWRKYSKHRGNLRHYWTDPRRRTDRHRAEESTDADQQMTGYPAP